MILIIMITMTTTTRKPFNQRPHFIMNNLKVTAGGLLIMDYDNDKCLLQYTSKKSRFEDLGGKVEYDDDTIVHTIMRELYEETNKLMGSKNNKISFKNVQFFYIRQAKYILAVIPFQDVHIETDLKKYGMVEEHTNFDRYLVWVDIKNIMEKKVEVNPRIMHYFNNTCEDVKYLFDFIQWGKEYFYEEKNTTQTFAIQTQTQPITNIFELKTLIILASTFTVLWRLGKKFKR